MHAVREHSLIELVLLAEAARAARAAEALAIGQEIALAFADKADRRRHIDTLSRLL